MYRAVPLDFTAISTFNMTYNPPVVKVDNCQTFDFWVRHLYKRVSSLLGFKTVETWTVTTLNFLYYCLLRFGYVGVSYDSAYGYYFQPCTLDGRNFYYQPKNIMINNPELSVTLEIGVECELLMLTTDYLGIWDIIEYYAYKLALLDNGIDLALINSKLAYMCYGRNKGAVEALKKMFDKINKGEPAVFMEKPINAGAGQIEDVIGFIDRGNVKQSYITTDLLQDRETVIGEFDREIGIPALPIEKKERLVTGETISVDANSNLALWKRTIEDSIKSIKKLYPDIVLEFTPLYQVQDTVNPINGNNPKGGENNADDNRSI